MVITTTDDHSSGTYPNDVRRSNIMEELMVSGSARRRIARHKKNNLQSLKRHVIDEYQDTNSPAFSKSANTVRAILANKFPNLHFTNRFVKDTLNKLSTTYSRTRLVNKNKHFFGMSFILPTPIIGGMLTCRT